MSSWTKIGLSWQDFIAGWIGGVAGLAVGHPADTIKVRQQTYGTALWPAVRGTFKHEGFRGFFKGMMFPFLTTGPISAIFFGAYGNSLQYFQGTSQTKVNVKDPNWQQHVFLAGAVGGFVSVVCTCPMELVKTLLQANTEGKGSWGSDSKKRHLDNSMVTCIKNVYKQTGFLGFYRGFVPMLWRDVPSYGLYTWVYEVCLKHVFQEELMNDISRQIFSGGLAGIVAWAMCMPFDLVKSRMQADLTKAREYSGMVDCIYKSYRTEGVFSWVFCMPFDVVKSRMQVDRSHTEYKGMYDCFRQLYLRRGILVFNTGIVVTCLRAFPVNAAIFVGYETGVSSWVMCMPFDLLKTRMQQDDPISPVYKGMIHCAIKSFKEEGYSIFCRGMFVTCLRAFPSYAAVFVGYAYSLNLLQELY